MKTLAALLFIGVVSILVLTLRDQIGAPSGHRHSHGSADPFAAEMDLAMARMQDGMSSVGVTGDPDRDFARMMIPHHQGAVDMAVVQLRFGRDERLRRLAQGIIVEQQQEIAVMRRILEDPALAVSAMQKEPTK